MDTDSSNAAAGLFAGGFMLFVMFFVFAVLALQVWLFWRILTKTGMNGALALLALIPIGSLILMFILALGKWPIEEKLAALAGGGTYTPPTATPPGTSVATT